MRPHSIFTGQVLRWYYGFLELLMNRKEQIQGFSNTGAPASPQSWSTSGRKYPTGQSGYIIITPPLSSHPGEYM